MFMYVITDYISTFTVLGQGHVKVKQILPNVYTIMYHRYATYETDKHKGY